MSSQSLPEDLKILVHILFIANHVFLMSIKTYHLVKTVITTLFILVLKTAEVLHFGLFPWQHQLSLFYFFWNHFGHRQARFPNLWQNNLPVLEFNMTD